MASSDHCFLLLDTSPLQPLETSQWEDYFRFEECWRDDPGCIQRVEAAWDPGSVSTLAKLLAVGSNLRGWQLERRTADQNTISSLQSSLHNLLQRPMSEHQLHEFALLREDLMKRLARNEVYWKQRSRVQWLSHGDVNSRYFHSRSSGRRRKNKIRGIFRVDGSLVDDMDSLLAEVHNYFLTAYQRTGSTPSTELLDSIKPVISVEMNNALMAPFSEDEIHTAFLQVHPHKAPGIDGLPGSFFKTFWPLVGDDILTLCLDLLEGRVSMETVNETVNLLLPKIASLEHLRHFRPIALCTVIYKTILKIMCFWLMKYSIILKRHPGTNQGTVLKLDMEKACDRIDSYCARVNGCLTERFRPKLVYVKAQQDNHLRGLRICPSVPRITHLLYADDCFLFLRNNAQEFTCVRNILTVYCAASGQQVNFAKSSLYFGANTPRSDQDALSVILGVDVIAEPDRVRGWTKHLSILWGTSGLYTSCRSSSEPGWEMMAWNKVCRPKRLGGLGVLEFKNGDIFNARLGPRPSFAWQDLFAAMQSFQEAFHRRVGQNSATRVFVDRWGSSSPIQLDSIYVDSAVNPNQSGAGYKLDPAVAFVPLGRSTKDTNVWVANGIGSSPSWPTITNGRSTGFVGSAITRSASSCSEWFEYIQTILSCDRFRLLLIVLYFSWQRRNELVMATRLTLVWKVVCSSRSFLASFDAAVGYSGSVRSSSESPSDKWCKPPESVIKINVDAACSLSERRSRLQRFITV
ncbi:hypothetical protein F3Y22_tig00110865pilonHSYRG00305 [Hibiscus syriacus]|uniref:Reverse transcriptase domain-containing protein n=1 Tax=Hibiscus syriacus TaxID=106335 RepID=A0A6A2ZIN4_HIBSY|nr:hypothetical protein F3Y22_tig00110865pilonHSYRG00305 [Hibiscus syriacus]